MPQTDVVASLKRIFLNSQNGRRHVAYFAAVPDALVPYMAPFWWHMDKLWALDLPVMEIPAHELALFLDVPYWRGSEDSRLFRHTARDVLSDPVTHANHWAQTMAADLDYPIMLLEYGDRTYLLDGFHRMLKAKILGLDCLPAKFVPKELLFTILIQEGFLGELNQLRQQTPCLITSARQVALELQDDSPEGTFPEWR